jgi:hypothetical protein
MKVYRMFFLIIACGLLVVGCVPLPSSSAPEPATPTRTGTPPKPTETPIPAAVAAQAALATKLGVAEDQITIVSVERVEWPDACLGAATEGELCAQVITPGYRIVLETGGKEYEAQTDESGQVVRFVTP